MFSIPSVGLFETDRLLDVLREIRRAHDEDLAATGGFEPMAGDFETSTAFQTRTLWRFGSYVVFACAIDGILEEVLRTVEGLGQYWLPGYQPPMVPSTHTDRLDPIRSWRNKVFAHTAFAAPRKEDNPTDCQTSLAMIAGNGVTMRPNRDIAFGGFFHVLGNYEPNTSKRLQQLTVPDIDTLCSEHFSSWWGILNAALLPLSQLTKEICQKRDPYVDHVDVSPTEAKNAES